MDLAADETAWGATLLIVLEFAYAEEIAFRLGIQSMLALRLRKHPRGDWIAIVVTTLIWTIAHSQTLDPEWVKRVQVLPVGLALGWLQRRHGVESAMLAHASFNLAGAVLLRPLLDLT